MSNYERSESEKSRGNRNHVSRTQIFNTISQSIIREATEKKAEERKLARYEIQGNGKYTHAGSDDRVNGTDFIYPEGAVTEEDKKSYYYGYITHGGRRLLAVVESLIKEGKFEEVALIAERDYNHGLEKGHLGMVESNSVYMEAFDEIASKGKLR